MKSWDELTDQQRDQLREAVAENCTDMYWCDRVWEGWSAGTMSQDDFHPAEECDDFLEDVARAVYERSISMYVRSIFPMADQDTRGLTGSQPDET